MFNIIPIVAIILALAVILIILLRHYRDILLIDVEKIPEERDLKKKNEIVAQRLERQSKAFFTLLLQRLTPLFRLFRGGFLKTYNRVLQYEHRLREERGDDFPSEKANTFTSAHYKEQGDKFFEEENYSEAEKSYLEAIRLAPKDMENYRALAGLYEEKRDNDLATETWKYILQHDPEDTQTLLALYGIAHREGKEEEAFVYLEEALQIEPNHPKLLDAMVESCIILGNRRTAEAVLLRLAEVNPENAKLEEFRERILGMPK